LSHLREDLSAFDSLAIPDCLEAAEYALQIARRIRNVRMECPHLLPGFLYVLEGTTLGNAVHHRDVVRAFGDRVAEATRYYAGYGDQTGEYWMAFRSAMNALPMGEDERRELIGVVHGFFDLLQSLYSALYPVAKEGWGYTASMLNPEAGSHPVPAAEAEMRAAVSAAGRCREEFPYFDARYGERGRSFARSDAAWLVTLAGLSQDRLVRQVEWLGRVLASRGMPRVTLERQLELLHEELLSAVPGEQDQYDGLLEVAGFLRSERLRAIPEPHHRRLAGDFQMATDERREERLLRAGELILSAVCDEKAGILQAVNSLLSWLKDPQRFSTEWIEEMTKFTELARSEVNR
jgi:hypothetical protein